MHKFIDIYYNYNKSIGELIKILSEIEREESRSKVKKHSNDFSLSINEINEILKLNTNVVSLKNLHKVGKNIHQLISIYLTEDTH